MAVVEKLSGFRREGESWFCGSSLPSDVVVVVNEVKFHLHKFPLVSRCGKMASIFEESKSGQETPFIVALEEFPGGADVFLKVAKFCYGSRLELTSRNVVILYCAAEYLEMNDDFGEENLQSKLENFFHGYILKHWKDCVLALQSCETVVTRADKLQLPSRCIDAMGVMICTDSSLFGWPMKMYGSLQSPGGSILWNGINTGAKLHSDDSNWWFEDVSYLGVRFFERLIHVLEGKGVNLKILARAVMHYGTRNLPGLSRWQGEKTDNKPLAVSSFSISQLNLDLKTLLETVIKLVPEKRGKSFCRFLLGLLRNALIMGLDSKFLDSLEKRIGIQLEFATLDTLLIPRFSDSETLYDVDCVERIVRHFVCSEVDPNSLPHSDHDQGTSPFSGRLKSVTKLVDGYLAEVASDVNLKPGKFRILASTLPDSSRTLYDALYRAIDIYLKEHPWLTEKESENLCSIIDFEKLSIDACFHASQNERLPMRVVLQVLFFEQMHLRAALANYLNVVGSQAGPPSAASPMIIAQQNQSLKVNMDRMRSRVGELEQEFSKIRDQMRKMSNRQSFLGTPRFQFKGMGCKLLAPADAKMGILDSRGSSRRA